MIFTTRRSSYKLSATYRRHLLGKLCISNGQMVAISLLIYKNKQLEVLIIIYSETCVRKSPSRLTLNSGWCGKSCLSYKGTCHVILLAKLHDMYLYKTTTFQHQPLKSISKVAFLHRFYCTLGIILNLKVCACYIYRCQNVGFASRAMCQIKSCILRNSSKQILHICMVRTYHTKASY